MTDNKNRFWLLILLAFAGYPIALFGTYQEFGSAYVLVLIFSALVVAYAITRSFKGFGIFYAFVIYSLTCGLMNFIFALLSHDTPTSLPTFFFGTTALQIGICVGYIGILSLPSPQLLMKRK